MKRVLILGASSAIAEHTARLFAQRGDRLLLVARNTQRLKTISDDLRVRGALDCDYRVADLSDTSTHDTLLNEASTQLGGLDIVLIAYGTLGEQKACEQDFNAALKELQTNCLSVLSLLTLLANQMEQQGSGTLAVISSVAGDRGRQSNYVYGTAKGAISIFLQGLRNRLSKSRVQVLTIKPGFVDSPMTRDFDKGLLWVKPAVIAQGIYRAIDKQKDVVYLPFFWRYIMFIIKLIPEKIFKRLSL
ncbi:MAG: SDR family oxidoreductase [Gammaproteobacteria bacterium]|jgi:decaprenylphospho-beta-D-erythro-pentofuranosid-2-ulose 2-reductase